MRRSAVAILGLLAVCGCGLGGGDSEEPARGRPQARSAEPVEARAIRGWSAAVNAGRYRRAASFFAAGAIVEQVEEIRLPDRAAAVAFNRSLPCRADVTDVADEGRTVVAAFRLRDGPGGACKGTARVRFRFRDGRFAEWRQFEESDAPPGVSA